MKQIKILVSFKDNEMIFPNIEFVKNDYNHVEFIFDFDEDDGKKVFELKKPNGKVFIKEIIDNKVLLSDFDEKGNIIPVINQSGLYEFEITKYKSDSKFTISKVCQFMARDEIVNIDDDIVDKDASLPILNDLITTAIALKENTEKIGQLVKEKGDYAEEQGNYAKEAASNVINANNQATKLINNFESNVNEYTSDFNKKATTKQEKFDSNSTTKINEYNDNATSKLKQYNDNHESKLKDYNDNASEKTKAFNSNSLLKTTAYDKNADDKLSAYNINGATKLDEYNDNATLKTEEYNTNASSKIEEYNSNATQKLEEYDEHSEELNNKINSTNSELEKLKDEILEIGEVSDSYIHVEDSAMADYQELSIDGVCEQETTTGITKATTKSYSTTINGLTITTDDDNTFTLNGTPTASINKGLAEFIGKNYILPAGVYYCHIKYISGSMNYIEGNTLGGIVINIRGGRNEQVINRNNNAITPSNYQNHQVKKFTLTNEEIIDRVQIITGTVLTFNNLKIRIWWSTEESDTYEKYTGGIASPSPDYPQEIKTIENRLKITSCNKNLFDKDGNKTIGKIYDASGNQINGSNDDFCLNDYIRVKPNSSYIISGSTYIRLCEYKNDKSFISRTVTSGTNTSAKFTTTDNTYYIRFSALVSSILDIQLEQNTQATDFVQHLKSQIEANIPEGEFIGKINDTCKDTLKVEYNEEDGQYHAYLDKKIKKYTFTGDETFSKATESGIIPSFFTRTFYDKAAGSKNFICNQFFYKGNAQITSNLGYAMSFNSAEIFKEYCYIQVPSNVVAGGDANGFNTWFKNTFTSENPCVVYYELAEPYTIDLGVVDMPITYNEITNLFTDSDLMPQINAKYYKNFISTIRNLQVNNANLKNELMSINNRLVALESANASTISDEEESEVVNNE